MSACTIHATLAEAPRAEVVDANCSRLHLVLHVGGCATRAHATVRYAGLGANLFTQRDAERMRPPDRVTLYCGGFGIDSAGHMRLFGVDHIEHHVGAASARTHTQAVAA